MPSHNHQQSKCQQFNILKSKKPIRADVKKVVIYTITWFRKPV